MKELQEETEDAEAEIDDNPEEEGGREGLSAEGSCGDAQSYWVALLICNSAHRPMHGKNPELATSPSLKNAF